MISQNKLIKVSDLVMNYGNGTTPIPVLKGVNLDVDRGEMLAITGPSGCGKSTLLFILGLFLLPSRGRYLFEDREVLSLSRSEQADFRRKSVGFVFQSADLFEKSTVYENLEYPLIYAGVSRRKRKTQIADALDIVNLGHRVRHPANLLSGGERQRVAVARALVNKPKVILADEPTGQLDRQNTRFIMDYFGKIVSELNTTMIVVTHDPQVAGYCRRNYVLEDGELRELKKNEE
jgi:putative ABC transport system ATP-binding protein